MRNYEITSCCLLVFLSICITEVKSKYTNLHQELHTSISSVYSNLQDYDIVYPEFIDDPPGPLSASTHGRIRRSSRIKPTVLKLKSADVEFLIELESNQRFIDPNFFVSKIKRHENRLNEEVVDIKLNNKCGFFTGTIISHEQRPAAISLCNGLRALLRTGSDDYVVEPIEIYKENESTQPKVPHIIYKTKESLKDNKTYCGKARNFNEMKSEKELNYLTVQLNFSSKFFHRNFTKRQLGEEPKNQTETNFKWQYKRPIYERELLTITGKSRAKRHDSSVTQRTIETLVVVDRVMLEKYKAYQGIDVASYVLTVMNMVNTLFHDATLNTALDISLVGLILMEDDKELNIGHNAKQSLRNFCRWQAERTFPSRKRPDHSILLTGKDICIDKDKPCDTLGLAGIGGMCIINESCSISEDSGLGLAFTIAHEIGHSLGMTHDGENNECSGTGGHIMSPTVNSLNGVFTWSSCSRKTLKQFLENNQTNCLTESAHPGFGIDHSRELPGQTYSTDEQCKLQFGVNHSICASRYIENKDLICNMLWCQDLRGDCETKYLPASEGSSCGNHSWCRRGQCVNLNSEGPQPIHGKWSDFGPWTECSRHCGMGVRVRTRKCNDPSPNYGGKQCDGKDTLYELCNTFKCEESVMNYRAEQCANYNSKPHRNQYFKWKPPSSKVWMNAADECQLLCEADGFGFAVILAPMVEDGTKCNDYNNDVCINGKCEHVGCDLKLHSNATVDKCGVCNGDNSTCRFINGTFVGEVGHNDYYFVTKIPQGATNIRIWERNYLHRAHAYIAVKSVIKDRYHLNGNWELDMRGEPTFAGVKWTYSRKHNGQEELVTDGPIAEDLIIEVLILIRNPGISYSYYLSDIDNTLYPNAIPELQETKLLYSWHQYVTPCNKSCAGGFQYTKAICLENDERAVTDAMCANNTKPTSQIYSCNTQPCPAEWQSGNWSQCNETCGIGVQKRQVLCVQNALQTVVRLSGDYCNKDTKPPESRPCNITSCAKWRLGRWSTCSKTCDRGQRFRKAVCMKGIEISEDKACGSRPRTKRGCRVAKCRPQYKWLITAWAKCSRTCGLGVQRRKVRCGRKTTSGGFKAVKRKRCSHLLKPKLSSRKRCIIRDCSVFERKMIGINKAENTFTVTMNSLSRNEVHPEWITGIWSQCSMSCGNGVKHRSVKCVRENTDSNACPEEMKPIQVQTCNEQPCHIVSNCKDQFPWCNLVSYHHACGISYFENTCCKSCSESAAQDD